MDWMIYKLEIDHKVYCLTKIEAENYFPFKFPTLSPRVNLCTNIWSRCIFRVFHWCYFTYKLNYLPTTHTYVYHTHVEGWYQACSVNTISRRWVQVQTSASFFVRTTTKFYLAAMPNFQICEYTYKFILMIKCMGKYDKARVCVHAHY